MNLEDRNIVQAKTIKSLEKIIAILKGEVSALKKGNLELREYIREYLQK